MLPLNRTQYGASGVRLEQKRTRREGKEAYTPCDTPGFADFLAVENTFVPLSEWGSPRACFRNVDGGVALLVALRALPSGVIATAKWSK